MAECSPNTQKDEDDKWEECMETFESTENKSQLDPNASNQENKPTTRDKNVWNAPGQSDSRNGKNSLGETSVIVYKLSCLFFQLRLRPFYTQLQRSFCVDSQLRG